MTTEPFMAARLPKPYREWNAALADELFPRGRAGVPVYLAVHDGLLNECGARRGLGGRDAFVRAVLELSSVPARLFVRLEQEAEFWSENGRGGEPPVIAGLAFAVLAAGEMATDKNATQANYYFRLNALMGIVNQGRPEQFECTPDLWRLLAAWIRETRRGELVLHGLNSQHPFVDPVQSQCLVRSCDLDELAAVVQVPKRSGQFLEPDEVVPRLRAWLLRSGAQSRLARLLGRDPDEASLSQAAEALCNALEGVGSDSPVIDDVASAPGVSRASLAIRPSKYPSMAWTRAKWLLRIPATSEAEEVECLVVVGDQVLIGKLDVREPACYDVEIASAEAAGLIRGEVTVTDESSNDVTPPRVPLRWFQDGALNGRPGSWTLIAVPSAGVEHAVISESAASLEKAFDALERPAQLLSGDYWPGPGVHAACAAVPRAGAILPGDVAVSSRASSLRLTGGLRMRRGIYLRGALPLPQAPEGATVRVQRDGETAPLAVVEPEALASLDLVEGRYSLECEGASAEMFVLEPRWRECVAPPSQPSLDRSMRGALRAGQMRGAVLDLERPSYAAHFRPGTRYRLYSPTVVKVSAPPDAGVYEYLSSHSIRGVMLMGRVPGTGPLPLASCFAESISPPAAEPRPDRGGMNQLLEYVSARGNGSVETVRAYCASIARDGAWHWPLSVLEDLGHIDVLWDDARSWVVAPAAAVGRADNRDVSILTGVRSRQTVDWLARHGIEALPDARCAEANRGPMPDCIVVSTGSLARAAHALRETRLRLFPESPSQQLALQTRPVAELGWWTGPAFTPPIARIHQRLYLWDARQLCWLPSPDVARQGLYRWRENGRPVYYLVANGSGVSVRDPSAAKWFVAPRDTGYLRYEPSTRRLFVPSAMDLPRIWKRTCTLASGLAPLRLGHVLAYEHLPLELARATAVRLNQPRTEGIL